MTKTKINPEEAILYEKIVYYAKDATPEGIYAFDTAENWARCMTDAARQLQERAIKLKQKAKKTTNKKPIRVVKANRI